MACSLCFPFKPLLPAIFLILVSTLPAWSRTERIVILKVDGLPFDLLDNLVRERDPQTGKSILPWIDHVFYKQGSRLSQFYARGLSLSAPSWALLDTGQHSLIKGNAEFDRLTQRCYDYLNFFSFYLKSSAGRRVDMPGVEVLDDSGIPLLCDAFAPEERQLSYQLYQRGARLTTLGRGLRNFLVRKNPREWMDEWTLGVEAASIVFSELERELLARLNDPRVLYLDFFTADFDHAAHLNRDLEAHLHAIRRIDFLVGKVWTAIERSPLAEHSTLVLVSDHGINTDQMVYSQGYNLLDLFASAIGGGHHVVTNRPPLSEYSFKSLAPTVPLITTSSPESYYLEGKSSDYPTMLLDLDGNERASIYLRHSDLNLLHILLQQLLRKDLSPSLRDAATEAFFATLERNRKDWTTLLLDLQQELAALRRWIEKQQSRMRVHSKRRTKKEKERGEDLETSRLSVRLASYQADERDYSEYVRTLANLLSLSPESFEPVRWKIQDLIARKTMGDFNNPYHLQHYVVGLNKEGLALGNNGSLDMERSFVRVDYPALLQSLSARNNVQVAVASRPVDFVALRLSTDVLASALDGVLLPIDQAVWLYKGSDHQALILSRRNEQGQLMLRYLPVAQLGQDHQGRVRFIKQKWCSDLPLQIFEDPNLRLPEEERMAWLEDWHTDLEWLEVLHATQYSNGLISLHEEFSFDGVKKAHAQTNPLPPEDELLARFQQRKRRSAQADFIVFANNHWNFNVRSFNPGGNHGSFFQAATHSTLMFAGGKSTGIPRGLSIESPYDSLSFVPTILYLTGKLTDQGLSPELKERGFRLFPGPAIREIIDK